MKHLKILLFCLTAYASVACENGKNVDENSSGAASANAGIISADVCLEDYIPLLQSAGYMVYPFDISGLLDTLRQIKVEVREYEYGIPKNSRLGYTFFSNMKLVSDFSEPDREKILSDGTAENPEKGIFSAARRMTISFYPQSDTLHVMYADVEGQGRSSWPLKLKPLNCPGAVFDGECHYMSRPFAIDSFAPDKFIPLVLYGSFWTDNGMARFCGEKVLPSDMSSEMLKFIPHGYVIGVTVI